MPIWRCPHCGTPQAETARCWVCRRSSTTCSTCRHFCRSVAAQLGYCGLDRKRLPLAGTELRGCWEPGVARVMDGPDRPEAVPIGSRGGVDDGLEPPSPALRLRDFVPVELVEHRARQAARKSTRHIEEPADGARLTANERSAAEPAAPPAEPAALPAWSERVTLFADAEL